jgi:DNA-binding transcriptional LysR family regulator
MKYPGDLLLHLEAFVVLLGHVQRGKQGAFERTARQLGIDRSVLRRRVQTLSEWLGGPLLEGRGAGLEPSAMGARLAERAGRIVEAAGRLREEVAQAEERLVIACTGTITSELLPKVLVDLEQRPRPVKLVVRRAGGEACEALVRGGEVDLGVVRADEAPGDLASRRLSEDRLWFVVPAQHPLARVARPTPAQMAAIPLILYGERSRTRARVMDRLGPLGAAIRIEVDGRSAAIAYVRAGAGATFLSLLPGHAVEATRVRAHDVTSFFERSAFYVIARKGRWSAPIVSDVVSELAKRR